MTDAPAVAGKEAEQAGVDLKPDSSLRDMITEQFSIKETDEEEVTEEAEETAEAETEETAADESEEAEEAAQDEPEADTEDSSEEEEADGGEVSDTPLEPPHHWSAADQKLFLDQTPEAQEFLLERSKAMDAAHTKRSQEIAPLRNVTEKWQSYMQQVGMTADKAFDSLMNAEYQLRTSPPERKRQILEQLGKEYGIDLTAQPKVVDDIGDPIVQQQIAPLEEKIQGLENQFQQSAANAHQVQNDAIQRQITEFEEAKDDKGSPKHPHFQEVYPMMVALAQADQAQGRQSDLGDLYNRACWSTDSVREKLQLAQQRAADAKIQTAKKEKAKKAKKASSSITGSPSGTTEQPKTLREEIASQFG